MEGIVTLEYDRKITIRPPTELLWRVYLESWI